MYMRTGSVVRPISDSTLDSAWMASSVASSSVLLGFQQQQIIGIRCFFHHLNTHVVDHLDDVFDLIGSTISSGRWSLTSA
jgi:hypothetical protein